MMEGDDILAVYASVSSLSSDMLSAARAGEWDHLVELERRCASQVQVLRSSEASAAMNGELHSRKVAMIQKILADDRAIREITAPWMAKLGAMLHSTGTERRLASTYGNGAA